MAHAALYAHVQPSEYGRLTSPDLHELMSRVAAARQADADAWVAWGNASVEALIETQIKVAGATIKALGDFARAIAGSR